MTYAGKIFYRITKPLLISVQHFVVVNIIFKKCKKPTYTVLEFATKPTLEIHFLCTCVIHRVCFGNGKLTTALVSSDLLLI